jgi:hypothetical protein
MLVIDADTHVDETESTWEYMREEEFQFKPTTSYPAKLDPSRPSSDPIRFTEDKPNVCYLSIR